MNRRPVRCVGHDHHRTHRKRTHRQHRGTAGGRRRPRRRAQQQPRTGDPPDLVDELGPHARAATAEEAAAAGDLVVVTIPLKSDRQVPAEPLRGKIVIDTSNYYPQRDGQIAALDDESTTTSELVQSQLPGSRVVKGFNNINYLHLGSLASARAAARSAPSSPSPATTPTPRRRSASSSTASGTTPTTRARSPTAGASTSARRRTARPTTPTPAERPAAPGQRPCRSRPTVLREALAAARRYRDRDRAQASSASVSSPWVPGRGAHGSSSAGRTTISRSPRASWVTAGSK